MFPWKKKEKSVQTFSDIMRGMQYSVNTAQQVLERHHLYLLNKYFDTNGFPQTKDFWITPTRKLNVPIISLINQNSLNINEMEIEFEAKINSVILKESNDNSGKDRLNYELDRSSFDMNFTPSKRDGDTVKVKIKFKTGQLPEGVSRIVEEFDKLIAPIDTLQAEQNQ